MEVQLRNDQGAIWTVNSILEAFASAEQDLTVWKISWSENEKSDSISSSLVAWRNWLGVSTNLMLDLRGCICDSHHWQ